MERKQRRETNVGNERKKKKKKWRMRDLFFARPRTIPLYAEPAYRFIIASPHFERLCETHTQREKVEKAGGFL